MTAKGLFTGIRDSLTPNGKPGEAGSQDVIEQMLHQAAYESISQKTQQLLYGEGDACLSEIRSISEAAVLSK